MTPRKASRRVIVSRMALVEEMLAQLRALPISDERAFFADSRNVKKAFLDHEGRRGFL